MNNIKACEDIPFKILLNIGGADFAVDYDEELIRELEEVFELKERGMI